MMWAEAMSLAVFPQKSRFIIQVYRCDEIQHLIRKKSNEPSDWRLDYTIMCDWYNED